MLRRASVNEGHVLRMVMCSGGSCVHESHVLRKEDIRVLRRSF